MLSSSAASAVVRAAAIGVAAPAAAPTAPEEEETDDEKHDKDKQDHQNDLHPQLGEEALDAVQIVEQGIGINGNAGYQGREPYSLPLKVAVMVPST